MSLLEIENVTLSCGGLVAVNDVSLTVNEGEVFALVGPNGAGKSTVFNLISRFYTPDNGSIRLGENDLLALPSHQVPDLGVARTFQNIELFEQATVLRMADDYHALLVAVLIKPDRPMAGLPVTSEV